MQLILCQPLRALLPLPPSFPSSSISFPLSFHLLFLLPPPFPLFLHLPPLLPSSSTTAPSISSPLPTPSPPPSHCTFASCQVQLPSVKSASGKEQAQGYKFQFKTDLTPKSLISLALGKKAKTVGSTTKEDAEDYILKVTHHTPPTESYVPFKLL